MANTIIRDQKGQMYVRNPRSAYLTKYKPSSTWKRTSTGQYVRDLNNGKREFAPEGLKIYDKNLGNTVLIGRDSRSSVLDTISKNLGKVAGKVTDKLKVVDKKPKKTGGARVAIRKPRPTNVVLPGYTKPDDITDIQAFQRDYLLSDLPVYKADGIWGAETQAAYEKWKANNKANRATLINSVSPKPIISDTSFDQPIDWTRNSFRPTFKLPERPLQHITDMYFGNSYRPYTFVNPILQQLKTPKIETTVPKIYQPAVQATQYVLSETPSLATPEYVPTLNFKNPNYTTIFKKGGNIQKFQKGNILISSLEASRNDFANRGINWVKNKKAESEQLVKARGTSMKKYGFSNNTADLQNALWQIGAFKGLKDRHGRDVVYNTATDGIMGPVTQAAIAKAKQMGYNVNVNSGKVVKRKNYAYGKTSNKVNTQQKSGMVSVNTSSSNNSDKSSPYSLAMDKGPALRKQVVGPDGFISYQAIEGLDGRPIYSSKLGNLGLFNRKVNSDGSICYQIKDDNGNIVTNCSQTGNLINRAMGKPTTDHAWFRRGVYGDSIIYDKKQNLLNTVSRPLAKVFNSINPSEIDPNNLQSGDFVDLYTEGSSYNSEASKGRGNSHTGTIYKPYNNRAYVIHNVNGDVWVDPLNTFGNTKKWAITRISRPGTKEHPYFVD